MLAPDPSAPAAQPNDQSVPAVVVIADAPSQFLAMRQPLPAHAIGSRFLEPPAAFREPGRDDTTMRRARETHNGLNRRSILMLVAGAGLATFGATYFRPTRTTRPARTDELRAFAERVLRISPDAVATVGVWARGPKGPWRDQLPIFNLDQLHAHAWQTEVRRQFHDGRVVIAEGWILSEHEVALCAAIAEVR